MSVYTPNASVSPRGWIVHVPAFAEEMNRARSMVNFQARQLAEQGFCVIVPDLFGTGDSSGEFGQASWRRWRQDIAAVVRWIIDQGGQGICLWGLRLGCLLALGVARDHPSQISRLILWQPVLAGEPFVTRFLRLRLVANLVDGTANSPSALRTELSKGAGVEVAGYVLSPELVREVESIDAALLPPPPMVDTCWLEVVREEGTSLPAGSRKVLDSWQAAGAHAGFQLVQGEPFWVTQEIAMAPALLDATVRILGDIPGSVGQSSNQLHSSPQTDVQFNGELLVSFNCNGDQLVGVLHGGAQEATTAVLIVVGGPQYRIGSHRQFVSMSRRLTKAGVPVLRFDCRGMGDSGGELLGFHRIGEDITSAADELQRVLPRIQRIVLLGLCDAATAAAFYAPEDERIGGLVLINPWVRSARGEARAYLKHYYIGRLLEAGFWKKVLGGHFRLSTSLQSLKSNLLDALQPADANKGQSLQSMVGPGAATKMSIDQGDLVGGMCRALNRFGKPALFILSGKDLTAAEFQDESDANSGFSKLLTEQRFERHYLPEADHTFSRKVWRDDATQRILEWVKAL